jgi:hypothetical protein
MKITFVQTKRSTSYQCAVPAAGYERGEVVLRDADRVPPDVRQVDSPPASAPWV